MRFLTLLLVLMSVKLFSQQDIESVVGPQSRADLSTKSVKAIMFYEGALKFFNSKQDEASLKELDKALLEDSLFYEAYLLKAEIYNLREDYINEANNYKKVVKIKPDCNPLVYLYYGTSLINTGEYKSARNNLNKALVSSGFTQKQRNEVKKKLEQVKFAIESTENPVPFNPVNLGPKINTFYNEYWPSLTADEKTLIMTVEVPGKRTDVMGNIRMQEDFFFSNKDEVSKWTNAQSFGPPLNTDNNEGSGTISFDGRFIFFTACNMDDGLGRCDIYLSEKDGFNWSTPKNIGTPINSVHWESQPSLSSDGRTLYFVSNRPGGKGKKDIWKSVLNDFGIWSPPINLGDSINTPEDEISPFIHQDNQTLYYSSNGKMGLGGQDIFVSKKDKNGEWGRAKNLGYPINTYSDEYGLIVNAKGTDAYFASNRDAKNGRDIFTFLLPVDSRPLPVGYVKGVVYDSDSKSNIGADFELSDLATSEVITKSKSMQSSGEYLVCLPANKDYGLNVSKNGYMFHSENFSLSESGDTIKPLTINIPLQTIQPGRKEVLRNIFYETDSWDLNKRSVAELNKLVSFLEKNTSVTIEIGGHTDNVGTNEYNIELSEKRAKNVFDYIVNKGISADRLTYKGYSFSEPIADNKTAKGRAINRRTEFKIISVDYQGK